MTDRGDPARCVVKACPVLGYFAHHDGLCPMHRETVTPRRPDLAETWSVEP